ncbi:DUF3558 family protein [Gordonia malaquae]|uniref:DUF3558 family protein n=1 Tax=Gordonia malaquae TaxID=410332 RepID=UPI003BF7D791
MATSLVIVGIALSSCQSGGNAVRDYEVRQIDDSGVRLPFHTVHGHRWNSGNDGTHYEPCTALSAKELETLGINPGSASDAAGTDGQTLRGCDWDYAGDIELEHWTVSQIVGNSSGLVSDKNRHAGSHDLWLEDQFINGRTIGVHAMISGSQCDTNVQSGNAIVTTLVMYSGLKDQPLSALCERAITFTRATIDRMPE